MLSCMQFLKHCGSISYKMRLIFYQKSMNILVFRDFFQVITNDLITKVKEEKRFWD